MVHDRSEILQSDGRAGNDASMCLLDDAMHSFKTGTRTNDSAGKAQDNSYSKDVEKVLKDFELSVLKPGDIKTPAGQRELLLEWGETSLDDRLKNLVLEPSAESKEKARKEANDRLENNGLYELVSKTDQQALTKMQEAILNGDTKALVDLVKAYKADPEKLEALGRVIEKNLKDIGAKVQVDVTDDGGLLVYDKAGRHAVEVSPNGKATVRPIQVNFDGSVEILEGRHVLRPKPDELARQIANDTVFDVILFTPMGRPPDGRVEGSPPGFAQPGSRTGDWTANPTRVDGTAGPRSEVRPYGSPPGIAQPGSRTGDWTANPTRDGGTAGPRRTDSTQNPH
jgi:hypothetical protein